ncbi:hypothetical protein MMC16_000923 [Acarospora aff. strigata]|nr:hypothetical protein [Acarospora aff. strigata]
METFHRGCSSILAATYLIISEYSPLWLHPSNNTYLLYTTMTTKNVIQQSTLCPSSAATASFILRSSITDSHIQRSTVETTTMRATDIVSSTAAQSDIANASILGGSTIKSSKVTNTHLQACKVEHCELVNCSFEKKQLGPGLYVGNVLQPAVTGAGQDGGAKKAH